MTFKLEYELFSYNFVILCLGFIRLLVVLGFLCLGL